MSGQSLAVILASEPLQLRYLGQLYQSAGFELLAFDSWQALRRALPELRGRPLLLVYQLGYNLEQQLKQLQRLHKLLPLACLMVVSPHQDPNTAQAVLAAGADDYLIQPFGSSELLSRSQAHLRRLHTVLAAALQAAPQPQLRFGPLLLLPQTQELDLLGKQVKLTATEFKLLHLLALRPNQVLSREQVYQLLWQSQPPSHSRRLDNFVLGLRKKMPLTPLCELQTLYGEGYTLQLQL